MSAKVKSPLLRNTISISMGAVTAAYAYCVFIKSFGLFTFLFGLCLGFLFTLLFGLPCYALLSNSIRRKFYTPVIGGFLIGILSVIVFYAVGLEILVSKDDLDLILAGGLIGLVSAFSAWLTWMDLNGYFK